MMKLQKRRLKCSLYIVQWYMAPVAIHKLGTKNGDLTKATKKGNYVYPVHCVSYLGRQTT
jgi:hypothetical protein